MPSTMKASAPTGKFTKKIQCQLRFCTRKPPSSGPMTVEMPKAAPSTACALPRSRAGSRSPTSAMQVTISPPPPAPWMMRPAITMPMLVAVPQITAPRMNTPMPHCSTILRP